MVGEFEQNIDVNRRIEAARHTSLVGKLKVIILTFAVLLILTLIILPLLDSGKVRRAISFKPHDASIVGDKPTMMRPRFHGINDKNQPYNISAEKAVQLEKTLIEMHIIDADIYLEDGSWLMLSSESGLYDIDKSQVKLSGNVNVFVDNGYEMSTSSAVANIKIGVIEGKDEVLVHGGMGAIRSKGFIINGNANEIKFLTKVRLKAYRNN